MDSPLRFRSFEDLTTVDRAEAMMTASVQIPQIIAETQEKGGHLNVQVLVAIGDQCITSVPVDLNLT